MTLKLPPRLDCLRKLVRTDRVICDVGTDHALLPCRLYLDGARKIIASDINDGPLKKARETIRRYIGDGKIKLVQSDGLDNIPFAEDIIIAGMGGELVLAITAGCRFANGDTRFILQPMTKPEVLRAGLYRAGFEILSETTVTQSGKTYPVMYVRKSGVIKEVSPAFSYIGLCEDKNYLTRTAETLYGAAGSCEGADNERARYLRGIADEIIAAADKL